MSSSSTKPSSSASSKPISSRQKKKHTSHVHHNKRTTVPLSDGWSLVTRPHGSRNVQEMPISDTPLPTTKPWSSISASTSSPNDLPHEEQIQARTELINRCRSTYGASKTSKAVRGMIRQALNETGMCCDSAVLVGLGELDAAVNNNMRGPWQLALFLDCADFMEKELESRKGEVVHEDMSGAAEKIKSHKNGNEDTDEGTEKIERQEEDEKEMKGRTIKLYAQDPQFEKLEKDILTSYGFIIVEAPEVRHHITPTTFLFAPFVDWPMLIPQIIGARDPFLYIGSDKDVMIEVLTVLNPVKEDDTLSFTLEMVQLFIQNRKKWFIPEFGPGYMALYSLTMYWLDKSKPLNAVQRKAKDDIGRIFEGGLAKAIARKHMIEPHLKDLGP